MPRAGRVSRAEKEIDARLINAEPWEPPPGMVKRQCEECGYFFSTPAEAQIGRCPDCAGAGSRTPH